MNFKQLGLGLATVATFAGATMLQAPAQAATVLGGSQLNLTGDARLEGTGGINSFRTINFADVNASGIYSTPTGTANVGLSSSGSFEPFRGAIAILQDLTLKRIADVDGSQTFSLEAPKLNFITLGSVTFDLQNFTLTRVSNTEWFAQYTGTFQNLPGVGEFSTQGAFTSTNGSTFSMSTTAIPTPALLPGLAALGAMALRKRKEEAELEA